MKNFIITLCLMLMSMAYSQNRIFIHKATPESIIDGYTFLNHPLLNGNPDAKLLVTHNWNPSGGAGEWNNKNSGVFYSFTENKWAIYNEDLSSALPNRSYNVYIAQDDEVFTIASSTITPVSNYLEFDYPGITGNPQAFLGVQTYWNPNEVVNNTMYGFEYATDTWYIYDETFTGIPQGAAFFVLVSGIGVQNARHISTAGNISVSATFVDHPLLNNQPDAIFFVSHIYGSDGASVDVKSPLGVFYSTSENKWAIFREDGLDMPQNAGFNLFIYDSSLAVEDNTMTNELSFYPNPVKDNLYIRNNHTIENVKILDLAGKILSEIKLNSNEGEINMQQFPTGIYFVKITTSSKSETVKIIKK